MIGLVYVDSLQHSHAFTEDDLRVLTALANVAAAKIENVRLLEESLEKRRMEEDMRMAAEIQNGLLPREAPQRRRAGTSPAATGPAAPWAATTTTSRSRRAGSCSRSATSRARGRARRC